MRRALPAVVSSLLTAGFLFAGPPALQAQEDPTPSTYTSVSPARVLDTRNGTGTGTTTPVGPGATITLDLAGNVPEAATAVVLNVTGVAPTVGTFVTVYPTGIGRPTTSNLNLSPGDTRPIQVTVALGANRSVNLFNNAGSTHLLADLAGYYAPGTGAKFTALSPNRVLDTRSTGGPLGPRATRVLDLTNRIPTSATAVTFNLTGTGPTATTFVSAFPTGGSVPNASSLNLPAGDTRANLVTVAVGADRKVSLFNNAGDVQLIADLTGFYTPEFGASFVPINPARVLDTRNGTGVDGRTLPVTTREIISVDLTNAVPLTATGAIINITGVSASASTFVTAWPQFENQPAASTLNLGAGQTVPNAAVVSFSRMRGLNLFNNAGDVHLIADLAGVFAVSEQDCTTGCVYAWGDNFAHKLGTGETVTDSGTPTQVAGLSGVRAVDGGGYRNGYALKTDGTVRAWGSNDDGQLGNGWTSDGTGGGSAVPVPVTGLTGVSAIAAGGATAFALKTDGTVWSWGAGVQGILGNGGTTDVSVPVRVSGLTNVVSIANTGTAGYAVRADGTVWAWGSNAAGALGQPSSVAFTTTPVQVAGLDSATSVAGGGNGGYAVRADGTVWAWGVNTEGQLGNGSSVLQSATPVRVGDLTGVTSVAGGRYNGYATRADGTVWAWGAGSDGALGSGVDCSQTDFPCASGVPVQVAKLADVTAVASFEYGGLVLRADNTISGWGFNGSQTLANDSAYWSAPQPVPANGLSGVSAVGAGEYSAYAVVPSP
ncbi:RCC1 domain-containing protein [Actinophytocola oryzae]|uniref:Alpha-tubulin suppressor-like RCC1 family protein n=1 Tax=Actinophytocola oryzae TaxID=502181 RepID=A0A4R7VXN2_9PSEU|nr:RCC1 domain-containing protein [Actinophytocola oryzae]TDV54906.1 alpha-tubulin suppressor-like RCC1 family protein [Actinophytocola oryzae]